MRTRRGTLGRASPGPVGLGLQGPDRDQGLRRHVRGRGRTEPAAAVRYAYKTKSSVACPTGVQVQEDEAQGPPETTPAGEYQGRGPSRYGVVLDLGQLEVGIKADRRDAIQVEIPYVFNASKRPPPGQASKLEGQLYGATTSFFERTGRALMRPPHGRQHEVRRPQALREPQRLL